MRFASYLFVTTFYRACGDPSLTCSTFSKHPRRNRYAPTVCCESDKAPPSRGSPSSRRRIRCLGRESLSPQTPVHVATAIILHQRSPIGKDKRKINGVLSDRARERKEKSLTNPARRPFIIESSSQLVAGLRAEIGQEQRRRKPGSDGERPLSSYAFCLSSLFAPSSSCIIRSLNRGGDEA